jgi:hypothetical protein
MVVLDMYSAAVGDHNDVRIKLSHLIEQEILDDESDEIALMVLHILFGFHDLFELVVEATHANGERVDVLVKVFGRLIVFVLI